MEELSIMARRMIEEEEVNVLILTDRGVTKLVAPERGRLEVLDAKNQTARRPSSQRKSWRRRGSDGRQRIAKER